MVRVLRTDRASSAFLSVALASFVPATAALLLATLVDGARGQVPNATATVHRDVNGLPHITADNEETAWYALGYEQARDALLIIQCACKAAQGQLTWAIGTPGLGADCAVRIFDIPGRLRQKTTAQLRAMFAPVNPAIQGNFYDNVVAYTAGVNAYRLAVANAVGTTTPEGALKQWLSTTVLPGTIGTLSWVYSAPVSSRDVLAQGAVTSAAMSLLFQPALINSSGSSYSLLPGSSPPEDLVEPIPVDPMSAAYGQSWLDELRQRLASLPGAASAFSGSNTFGWSALYCGDATTGTAYTGLLADPHQGVPPPVSNFANAFVASTNHLWFAHIKITPSGSSQPTFDLLGHFPHAAAASFSSHNRSVAMGGTLGSPNYLDQFLLRLEESTAAGSTPGSAATPYRFYSYYHDSTPPTNTSWQGLTAHTVRIRRPDNSTFDVPYWRAQSFGIVMPTAGSVVLQYYGAPAAGLPVIYGERVEPTLAAPRWRVGDTPTSPRMRFWDAPQTDPAQPSQLLTSPMVVTLRAPIDAPVSGEDMHLLLMRDFWEMSHATSVNDIAPRTNGAVYSANVCFVDRAGKLFSTVLSALPQRGDDVALQNSGYTTVDKWAIYSRGYGPVPARHSDDRMFDWNFGSTANPVKPAPLFYLQYPTSIPPSGPFKPMTLQDQQGNGAFPPTAWLTAPNGAFRIESGFFTSACNDMVWGFSRKRDDWTWIGPPTPWVNASTDNTLLSWVLAEGVLYCTPLIGLEGDMRQQIVVDRFTRQAQRIIQGGSAGLPPLTPAQMREFVVNAELYADAEYSSPTGPSTYASLPSPIRQLKEVVDHPSFSTATHESPLETAEKELKFFDDLWQTLFSTTWDNHPVAGAGTVSLRDLWVLDSVAAHPQQIFWYDDVANPSTSLRWVELPADFPLIDFYWPEAEVSDNKTLGALNLVPMTTAEESELQSLVDNVLVPWDPAGATYENVPTSPGACLLLMLSQRYRASAGVAPNDYGRHWVHLRNGTVDVGTAQWTALNASGGLPSGTGPLVRQSVDWAALQHLAFPFPQQETLLSPKGPQGPYGALYDASGQVKTQLSPQDSNDLVRFFLELGNFWIDPLKNNGNPSRKLARAQLLGAGFLAGGYPPTYPLPDGLRRLTALRALLDTGTYLKSLSGGTIPPMDAHFRARAYDTNGQVWPASNDAPCVGGALRGVTWNEDQAHPQYAPGRGLQPKFLGLGGSIASMVALFPSGSSAVDSSYWCTPGLELFGTDPNRYTNHMQAFTTNTLMPTHYDDFLLHVASTTTHVY